jgi:prepilin-type N-terminal cleavage/methylation domain-containing protein
MRERGFTLLEMIVAVTISGVVAASAIVGISTISARNKRNTEFDRVLADVQQQRAIHVAAGRTELLMFCVDCIDSTGAPSTGGDVQTLDAYLADTVTDRTRGRPLFSERYDLTLTAGCSGLIALDALGRSIDLPRGSNDVPVATIETPLATTNCTLKLDPTSAPRPGDDGIITFGSDGRLLRSFGPPILPEPPHAQNFSARTTPNPMPRGRFEGDASRASALPLH